MNIKRVNKILEEMNKEGLEQILITSPAPIFYLTGKWFSPGERMVALYLNKNNNHKLIVNKLFPVNEDLGVDLVWYSDTDNPIQLLCESTDKTKAIGIDKNWPSHFLIKLMEYKGASSFVNASPLVDRVRMIKDEDEIALMKESSKINDTVMKELWENLKEGESEKYYCNLLTELYAKHDVHGFSFSPIIALSPNGADPHHKSGGTVLKNGHSLIIDIGGVYNYYHSDMTRTVFLGSEPNEEHKKIYNICREANEKAIAVVKEGVKFSDIDKAARDHITACGYGEYFLHRTGHSIGIEGHEFGDVSSTNNDVVKAGMVFSIEPGIYLNQNFGVRIEDLVLVTKDGCEVLNSVTKDIVIL